MKTIKSELPSGAARGLMAPAKRMREQKEKKENEGKERKKEWKKEIKKDRKR